MNKCTKCNVKIIGTPLYCPLCKNILEPNKNSVDIYPSIPTTYEKYKKIINILLFLSFITSVSSIVINQYTTKFIWYPFVILGIISCWLLITSAIKLKKNKIRSILALTTIISSLVLLWDYATGWHKWSIEFVLPTLFSIEILASIFLAVIIKIRPIDWLFYVFLEIVLGFSSLIFIKIIKVNYTLPSIICLLISIIALGGITIFASNNLISELKKRLHV